MKSFLLLLATVASAWAADISKFKSISVTQTNYANEVNITNGATLGGVRKTAWPAGATAGTVVNSGTPVTTAIPTYSDTTGTNITPSSLTVGSLTNLTVPGGAVVNAFTNNARTASTFVVAAADKSDTSSAASSVLAATLTDETGTGASVFGTSPVFNTSIELRNGASAQTIYVNGTYTDSSNYRRGKITDSTLGVFDIGSEGLGSGASGNQVRILTDGTARMTVTTNAVMFPDNTISIGASGANRPSVIYVGTGVHNSGYYIAGGGSPIYWNSRSVLRSPSDGIVTFYNNAETGFSRLQFGGTYNTFPALKRSSTTLQVRLADDSGDAPLSANDLTLSKTITAGGTTGNQTINKASGSVNFAAAAQTIVVTNNLVTANSVIMATVATDDTTAFACKAIPESGQFTLKLNAAATAETRVSFLVTN